MPNNVPNLDAMEHDDLMSFWQRAIAIRPIKLGRELFPSRPVGYTAATRNLGCYAVNKATAIGLRLRGRIRGALRYEAIADGIYKDLPEWAKW